MRYKNLSFVLEKMSQPAPDHQNPKTSIICMAGACIHLESVFVALIFITSDLQLRYSGVCGLVLVCEWYVTVLQGEKDRN